MLKTVDALFNLITNEMSVLQYTMYIQCPLGMVFIKCNASLAWLLELVQRWAAITFDRMNEKQSATKSKKSHYANIKR